MWLIRDMVARMKSEEMKDSTGSWEKVSLSRVTSHLNLAYSTKD